MPNFRCTACVFKRVFVSEIYIFVLQESSNKKTRVSGNHESFKILSHQTLIHRQLGRKPPFHNITGHCYSLNTAINTTSTELLLQHCFTRFAFWDSQQITGQFMFTHVKPPMCEELVCTVISEHVVITQKKTDNNSLILIINFALTHHVTHFGRVLYQVRKQHV